MICLISFAYIFIFCRSVTTGSCLYSSVSLRLVGDNSLVDDMRIMTCIELYLNAHYYCKHPCFISTFSEHSSTFTSLESMLCISVSNSAFDTGLRNEELVKAEAYHNCKNLVKWSGFLSILALSSVTGMKFFSHYPDCGLLKYKLLFNQAISPRKPEKQIFNVHILFCYEGNLPVGDFRHNHYVPLIFEETASMKRKSIFATNRSVKKKFFSSTAQQAVLTDALVPKSSTKLRPTYRPSTSLLSFFKNNSSQSSCSPSKPNTSSSTTQPLEEIPVFSAASTTTQKSASSSNLSLVTSAGKTHAISLSSKVDVSLPSKQDDNILSNVNAITSPLNASSDYDQFDVSFFRSRVSGLRDDEIHDMIKSVFVPSEQHSFPKSGSTGRHFRHA